MKPLCCCWAVILWRKTLTPNIGKQRKLHMSRDEVLYYKGGREINVIDIGKCKLGIVICYTLNPLVG